jgi:hypothetical protein
LGEGVAEAEAEAELEGEMRDLDTEDAGVGISFPTGMAVVTDRRETRPVRRVVRCIVADFFFVRVLCRCEKY